MTPISKSDLQIVWLLGLSLTDGVSAAPYQSSALNLGFSWVHSDTSIHVQFKLEVSIMWTDLSVTTDMT